MLRRQCVSIGYAICGVGALRRLQRRMIHGGGRPAASPVKDTGFAAGYTINPSGFGQLHFTFGQSLVRPKILAVRYNRIIPIAVFALFTALFFWKITFSGEYSMICLQDWGVQFYPWYQFATHEIKINHTLPLWDPFSYSGRNFIGEIQTAVFYPWNWFVFVGPLRKMLSVDWVHLWILLSFVLGAWGMYRCARLVGLERGGSVLAGVAFVFGGYMARRAVQQINVFQGSLWLPVVFLFFLQMLRQTD